MTRRRINDPEVVRRYLLDHQDEPTEVQAAALGLSQQTIRDARSRMIKRGDLPPRKPGAGPRVMGRPGERARMTKADAERLVAHYLHGADTLPNIAAHAGVSKAWLFKQVAIYKQEREQ